MNFIGDVAGRFDELMELIGKMPKEEYVFLGDLNDRGPDTPKVIDWVMKNGTCLHSNHGDMFVDFVMATGRYHPQIFIQNGGIATLRSYDVELDTHYSKMIKSARAKIPGEHIEYLASRPYCFEKDGVFASHAVLNQSYSREEICVEGPIEHSLLWNRDNPKEKEGVFQIFGHNGIRCLY